MSNKIQPLTGERFEEAVKLLVDLNLDSRDEIVHHLKALDAHLVYLNNDEVIGIIGWYKDDVNYANKAMGADFPGEDAFWVGFFGVKKGYQSKGVGTELITAMENNIVRLGAHEWWVSSVPDAKEFYRSKGFEVACTGEISGREKYFMKKVLN